MALEKLIGQIVPWLSLFVSLGSLFIAGKAYRLAANREQRSAPDLSIYLETAYVLRQPDESQRIFALLIAVSNRSDSPNAIARAELELLARTPAGVEMPIRLPLIANLEKKFPEHVSSALVVPCPLTPRQTLKGWCYFHAPAGMIPSDQRVLDQLLMITDSNGLVSWAKPDLLNEISVPRPEAQVLHPQSST